MAEAKVFVRHGCVCGHSRAAHKFRRVHVVGAKGQDYSYYAGCKYEGCVRVCGVFAPSHEDELVVLVSASKELNNGEWVSTIQRLPDTSG